MTYTFHIEVNCKDTAKREAVKDALSHPDCPEVCGQDVRDAYGELGDVIEWLKERGMDMDNDCYLSLTGEIAGMP